MADIAKPINRAAKLPSRVTKLCWAAMPIAMDPTLRIATVTLLLFTALGVIRHPHPWRWKVCFVLFATSLSAFVINNSAGVLTPQGTGWFITWFFIKMFVLLAWWLVQCSFSDGFRFDAYRLGVGGVWVGVAILSMWRAQSNIEGPFDHAASILVLALMLHLIWFLIMGREDDLRLRRRDVRLWLPAAIIGLLLIDVGVDFTLGYDWHPAEFLYIQNALIFLCVVALAFTITQVDANIFASAPHEKLAHKAIAEYSENAQRIDKMMREAKLYLEPDIRLSHIVARLPISEASTRKLIHTEFGCEHFRTFLNRYRIQHAISLLEAPDRREDKLIGIAFDSGFASLASFQRAFKRETGKTASKWRN